MNLHIMYNMLLRALLLAMLLLVAACADEPTPQAAPTPTPAVEDTTAPTEPADDPDDEGAVEEEPVLTIVATVAPIADVVAQVAGERVEVVSLVPPGADAHTYEPRASDVATMQEADAFFGVGYDLNPAAVRLAEANLPDGAPVVLLGEDALDADDLIADDGHSHDEDDGHSHDEDDGHSHDEDDGHSHDEDDGHSHDDDPGVADDHTHERNPHVWTSVRLVQQLAEHIADVLTDLDPDAEAAYTANAADLADRLAELDEAIGGAAATIPEANRIMVVYHDAWGYFANDYGLEVVAAVQPSDFSEPSAGDVAAIIEQVRETGVPALFGSEVFGSRVVAAIAEETGASYVGTLSDDVLPGAPGDPEHSYEGLMVTNARLVVESLGGDTSALDGFPRP
jgi:ABC-type Zn uptake system ZnuABC Zn-binding protein ZnuA